MKHPNEEELIAYHGGEVLRRDVIADHLSDCPECREELASLFGRNVDLVEERAIRNPYRKASILRDKSVLYAA